MITLALRDLSFSYGAVPVLKHINATIEKPELIALIGPNGAGKSTLIHVIAGLLRPTGGGCLVDGEETASLSREKLCRMMAHVPQQVTAQIPFTVEDVVLTGRTPYSSGLYETDEDLAAVEHAIELTRLQEFRKRPFSKLSGGEQQRVLVAAAIAQSAPIFLLDEPGAHLDPENQTELWNLLAHLRGLGHIVLIVTHHLNLAAQRSDRVWLLSQGTLAADGPPAEAMHPERLEPVFRVPFHQYWNQEGRVFLSYG